MYGTRKLESSIFQTAILGSFPVRQATPSQGRRTCPPEECSWFTPSRTKPSGLQGASESWFPPPASEFSGEGGGIPVCLHVMRMDRTSSNSAPPWILFCRVVFFFFFFENVLQTAGSLFFNGKYQSPRIYT